MKPETRKIIRKLRPRLSKIIGAYDQACGDGGMLANAEYKEQRMLEWLGDQIDSELDNSVRTTIKACQNHGYTGNL